MGSIPPTAEALDPLGRHEHGTCCWWNHLEARWHCIGATTRPTN